MSEPKMIRVKPIGAEGPILEVESLGEGPAVWNVRLAPGVAANALVKDEWELVETTVDRLSKLGVHAVVAFRTDDSLAPFVKNHRGVWQRLGNPYSVGHVADAIEYEGWEVIFPGLEES